MAIFAVSDVVWQALIAAVVTVILAWMSQRTKNAVVKTGDAAAVKVDEVKATLETSNTKQDQKLDGLAHTADATHVLVNNNMQIQLQLNATVTRRLADLTHDQKDVGVAEAAEKLLREHMDKQAAVDSGPGAKPPGKEIASVTVTMKGGQP